jgi:hypothetical protein
MISHKQPNGVPPWSAAAWRRFVIDRARSGIKAAPGRRTPSRRLSPVVRSIAISAAFLLCSLSAIAQTSSAPASALGTIRGKVVNESGRPLPNVRVIIRQLGSIEVESTTTTTDREGKFEMSGLKPVNYRVSGFLQGYAPVLRDPDDPRAGIYRVGDSVTITLTKGGVITGTITNQAGEPVVAVNVRALMLNSDDTFAYNLLGSADQTDDRGVYRIYGLAEGTYVVWAGGGAEANYPTGDPYNSDVPTYAPASTRDTAREIMVRAGAETHNVDIQYRGDSGHIISGTINGPQGDRSADVGVFLVSASGPQWEMRASKDPHGQGFMIAGVDDGSYHIVAISFRLAGELMLSPPREIKVRGADVTGVELTIQPLSSVSGRIALEETKAPGCTDKQRPVFTETIMSAQSSGVSALLGSLRFLWPTAHGDEQGNITLQNLPSGRYYFTTQHFTKDWYLKSLLLTTAGKPVDAARSWTTLKPGERLNGLTVTLAQGAASLRGQIALREAETLTEKLHVYLVPAEKDAAEDPLRFYGAAVGENGRVELDHVAPGRYLVLAREPVSESPLTKLRSPDATAFRAKLRREAEMVKTEIELKPCQKVSDFKVRFKH